MIGRLPTTIEVGGKDYAIRTDYRDCLLIIQAFLDEELKEYEKVRVMLEILYVDPIPIDSIEEAYKKGVLFLDGGNDTTHHNHKAPLYNFVKDEQMIFSALNKVANKEIRAVEYLHFWTFLAYFNEIGEGMFATVVRLRKKKRDGQKLEKWERDFIRDNPDVFENRRKYTAEEERQRDEIRKILGIPLKGGN